MGLSPIWRLRGRSDAGETLSEAEAEAGAAGCASEVVETVEAVERSAPTLQGGHGAAARADVASKVAGPMDSLIAQHESLAPLAPPFASKMDGARAQRIGALGWDELEAEIRACNACVLCERRKQAVPGVGDRRARWMLVGEGPGAEEDQRGEPFVGQAGKLLDNMLAAIDLKRGEDVYIANAVKCRPPHNRTPEKVELAACLPYLERQIALVQPRLLIALGRPAAQALLDREISIGAARGKLFEYRGTPVVVTYHPAYLLRNPQDKAKAWEDLCFARQFIRGGEALSDRRRDTQR
jgi:DNA polymerase